jgi:hypothetical protein
MTTMSVLAAAGEQLPEDVGKSGPLGLLLIVLLLTATAFLVKSMGRHLKKVPRTFDREDRIEVPDTPAELLDQPAQREDILDTLRRAPLAIEPPRPDGDADDPRGR